MPDSPFSPSLAGFFAISSEYSPNTQQMFDMFAIFGTLAIFHHFRKCSSWSPIYMSSIIWRLFCQRLFFHLCCQRLSPFFFFYQIRYFIQIGPLGKNSHFPRDTYRSFILISFNPFIISWQMILRAKLQFSKEPLFPSSLSNSQTYCKFSVVCLKGKGSLPHWKYSKCPLDPWINNRNPVCVGILVFF